MLKERLLELEQEYGACGLKIEFETEDISLDEILALRQISGDAGLKLAIKIGGCGAIRDICDAKRAGADSVSAPMIESVYAVKKFVKSIEEIYNDSANSPALYINIETKNGMKNLDEIIYSEAFQKLDGIVIGRNDLAKSLGIKDIAAPKLINTVLDTAQKVHNTGKTVIIGGKITPEEDFSYFPDFAGIETRKIIFPICPDFKAITKALEFELAFMETKQNKICTEIRRVKEIQARIQTCVLQ